MRPPALEAWDRLIAARDPAGLDALLADEVVFHSPVVHTPQRGRAATSVSLAAAIRVLASDSFRYVGEWRAENSAVLEFMLEADGLTIDGADFIAWDEADRIVSFKVMVRPLKAIEWLRQRTAAALASP